MIRAWSTQEAAKFMNFPADVPVTYADVADLGRLVPNDAPHQGVVIEVAPLEDMWLADLLAEAPEKAVLLVLDQVTDPHNVGAIMRSAAAFGAIGIVTQDRHSPTEGGVLAKAASGALERVPWARVVNLSRALEEIAEAGFWRIGLAGDAKSDLKDALGPQRVALVLGAEGPGMRQNVRDHCDALARLPISDAVESLNVSNAAARSRFTPRSSQPDGQVAGHGPHRRLAQRQPRRAGRGRAGRSRAVLDTHGRPEPRLSEPGVDDPDADDRRPAGQRRRGAIDVGQAGRRVRRAARPRAAARGERRGTCARLGQSRQKAGYLRSLAGLVLSGELDLANLPADDEEAIALLTKVKGIGRWSAEIYLLFAEGRGDVWPAGDLAVQIEVGRLLGLDERPSEKELRALAEAWRPHRGAAAVLAWHSYNAPPL